MARLNVIVEGETEEAFWNSVLIPHLANFNVFASAQRVVTNRKLAMKGGVVNYEKAKNHILRWLKQERGNDVFLTTMSQSA